MTPNDSLDRLHREIGFKRLNPLWAKIEIVLGLVAGGVGFMGGMKLATLPEAAIPLWTWVGPVLLITLGGYLTLAGHRSHLYQSNNRLAAHLAEIIRSQSLHQSENSS